jgi:hypothetical protein
LDEWYRNAYGTNKQTFIFIYIDSWVHNIKMELGEIGWGDVDWTGLVWLRIRTSENVVMRPRVA